MDAFTDRHWQRLLLVVLAATVLLHFAPLENHLDNDDAWNYVLEADRFLAGGGSSWVEDGSYWLHQNALRLFVSLTWILRWAVFGLWMPGWHLPGIVLHGVNAMLLCLVLHRLGATRPAALLGGLLWGVSPLHPFTVAWIGGNYDVFAGTFGLGAILMFLARRTGWGVVLCLGALTSKETGVFVVAVLGLLWLLYERADGWKAGFRRLWPYAAATVAILGFRALQIVAGGSIDQAGLPARTVGFSAESLLWVGPVSLASGAALPLGPLIVVGLLAVGAVLARGRLPWRVLALCAGAGWLLLVPVLLMREQGVAMSVDDVLYHARYLYLPSMFACGALAVALMTGRPRIGAVVVAGLVAFGIARSAEDVARLVQVDPAAGVVAETLLEADLPAGGDVWVLTNLVDQGSYRLLMSRWLEWKTKARFHFVQRGCWRVLERKPKLPFGLDFKDFYVHEGAPFSPPVEGPTFLLRHGGPSGGHDISVFSTTTRRKHKGSVATLDPQWTATTSERAGNAVIRENGTVEFTLTAADEQPTDYAHRPSIQSKELWLHPDAVWGIRVKYVATGAPKRMTDESRWARGYAELHWTAEGVRPSDSFVPFLLELNGQEQTVDIPLWFDPVWRASKSVARLGFHPYDLAAEVTLLEVAVIRAR